MSALEKKSGYLKGLIEGMQLDKDSQKGKLYHGIVDLLTELCEHADAVDEMLTELNDFVEDIDEDLSALEEDVDADWEGKEHYKFFDDEYDGEDDEDLPFTTEPPLRLIANGGERPESNTDEEAESLDGGLCPECGGLCFVPEGTSLMQAFICPRCGRRVHLLPVSEGNAPIAKPADDE